MRSRAKRGLLAGALAGAIVYALLAFAHVSGPLLALAAVAAVVCLPSARLLAQRVLINVTGLLFGSFVLWCLPWSTTTQRTALEMGLLAGLTVGLAVALPRRVLPEVEWVDILAVGLPGVASLVFHARDLVARTAPEAYLRLSGPWDYSAHYHLFQVLRTAGTHPRFAPLVADGSPQLLNNYPGGFHGAAADVATVLFGPYDERFPWSSMNHYLAAVSILSILSAIVLGCAVASIPRVRASRAQGPLVLALVTSLFVYLCEPRLASDGHEAFAFCVAMTATAVVLSLAARNVWRVSTFAPLAAVTAMAAHTWLPMGLIAAGAMAAAFLFRDRTLRAARWQVVADVLVLLAGLACVATSLWLITTSATFAPAKFVSAGGALTLLPHWFYFTAATSCALVAIVNAGVRRGPLTRRLALLAGVLALGLAMGIVYMAAVPREGHGGYFPLKFLGGSTVVALVLAATSLGFVDGLARVPRRRTRTVLRFAAPLLGLAMAGAQPIAGVGNPDGVSPNFVHPAPPAAPATPTIPPGFTACQQALSLPASTQAIILAPADGTATIECAALRGNWSDRFHGLWYMPALTEPQIAKALEPELASGRVVLLVPSGLVPTLRPTVSPAAAAGIRPI